MTTKLQILNHMLAVIGEDPVSNPESTLPSAITAREVLTDVNLEVQTRGWWFNKDYKLLLSPNGDGAIILPSNTIKVDPTDTASYLVQRGTQLYDTLNHTFDIGESVYVDITLLLDVEMLPEAAATYVKRKAAYDFYVNDEGDEIKAGRLEKRMYLAWATLQQQQLQNSDVNARNRPAVQELRRGIGYPSSSTNPNYPGGR